MDAHTADRAKRGRPDFTRPAIFVAVLLAVAFPIFWQSARMHAQPERRRVTLIAEARLIRYTTGMAPLLFDLQHVRANATGPANASGERLRARAAVEADLTRLEAAGAEQESPVDSCEARWPEWIAALRLLLERPAHAALDVRIGEATCFVTASVEKSELGYDDDPTVQLLASLVGLNIPGIVRRIGLTASLLDEAGADYDRNELLNISRTLGTVTRLQKNINAFVEDDEARNDAYVAKQLSALARPARQGEERFESTDDTLLTASVVPQHAAVDVERRALTATDALQPLAQRSLNELARRVSSEQSDVEIAQRKLVAFVCLSLAVAALVVGLAARTFDRRHARALQRVEAALADQLARAAAERALSLTEGRLRAVFESSTAAIAIFDHELCVVQGNGAFDVLRAGHPDIVPVSRQHAATALTTPATLRQYEVSVNSAAHGVRYLSLTLARVFEDTRCVYAIVTCNDVTEARMAEQILRDDAVRDGLTGLVNRKGFEQRFAEAYALPSLPFAIFFIDLDGFKPVNDRYGHAAGDAVLMAVGARLRGVVGAADVVARIGGDEFAVFVSDVDDEAIASTIAQRMLAALEMPISIASGIVKISASIGITIDEKIEPRPLPAALLAAADRAMYRAKAAGTGYSVEPGGHAPTSVKCLDV